jgi:hypothetical protein
MNLFQNNVKLRGFLGKEPEVPKPARITEYDYSVLLLATVSGIWGSCHEPMDSAYRPASHHLPRRLFLWFYSRHEAR